MGQVLACLPQEAPDVLTHVVLGARHPLGGQVLAAQATLGKRNGILEGVRWVQTLGGPVEVAYRDIVAQCYLPGNRALGQGYNWSAQGLKGGGYFPTHEAAQAALLGLAQDAARADHARQQQNQRVWNHAVNTRRH